MRAVLFVGLAVVGLGSSGCVSVDATELGVWRHRDTLPVGLVAVYRSASDVPGRYEEVALLDAVGESVIGSDARTYRAMRRKAASLGANAILLQSGPPAGTGIPWLRRDRVIAIDVDPVVEPTGDES